MEAHTRRVRITRHIIGHLEGSSAWQEPHARTPGGQLYSGPDSLSLVAKVKAARTLADGSCTVELTAGERDDLRLYVEVQEIGAADNLRGLRMGEEGYGEYAGELNACRALLRQLAKIAHTEAIIDRCMGVK